MSSDSFPQIHLKLNNHDEIEFSITREGQGAINTPILQELLEKSIVQWIISRLNSKFYLEDNHSIILNVPFQIKPIPSLSIEKARHEIKEVITHTIRILQKTSCHSIIDTDSALPSASMTHTINDGDVIKITGITTTASIELQLHNISLIEPLSGPFQSPRRFISGREMACVGRVPSRPAYPTEHTTEHATEIPHPKAIQRITTKTEASEFTRQNTEYKEYKFIGDQRLSERPTECVGVRRGRKTLDVKPIHRQLVLMALLPMLNSIIAGAESGPAQVFVGRDDSGEYLWSRGDTLNSIENDQIKQLFTAPFIYPGSSRVIHQHGLLSFRLPTPLTLNTTVITDPKHCNSHCCLVEVDFKSMTHATRVHLPLPVASSSSPLRPVLRHRGSPHLPHNHLPPPIHPLH